MPRRSRLDAAGVLHHVIIRGIARQPIFASVNDRNDFFERCGRLFIETKTPCYAWAFLTNHVHLLLRTGSRPLSSVMARLLSGYATTFNRRHHRSGHLFQNRYKSIICQEESYFKELVRYIHLNPVRARLVSDMEGLDAYRWSGHAVLVGRRVCEWQDASYALAHFGTRSDYVNYMEEGFDQGHRHDLTGGGLVRSNGGWAEVTRAQSLMKGDERILGDTSFVMALLHDAQERLERRVAARQSGLDLRAVEKRVSALFSLDPRDLYGPRRARSITRARGLFCFWAVRELGLSQKALADLFCVTETAITYSVRRGEGVAREQGLGLQGEEAKEDGT